MSVGFLDKLKSFNKNDVPDKVVAGVEKFRGEIPEFTLAKIKT